MNNDDEITLEVLASVHTNHAVTQRSLSKDLGIALGLTNAYLKRCIRKGLIKVQQIPRNRYAYYLTPDGFSEKSRLTAQYLTSSFNFYRRARNQCDELLALCKTNDWSRITVHHVSDLAEIAILCAAPLDVKTIGIVDPNQDELDYHGVPMMKSHKDQGDFDAIFLADLIDGQGSYDTLSAMYPDKPILVPELLRISKIVEAP